MKKNWGWIIYKIDINTYTKHAVCAVLLFCIGYVLITVVYRQGEAEYLLISHNNALENKGPITLINLTSGKIEKPQIPGIGCTTKRKNSDHMNFLFYCLGEPDGHSLWEVNLENNEVLPYTSIPKPFTNINVSMHPSLIVSENGMQFYNSGGPGFMDDGSLTDAGIVIVEGSEAYKILISDRTQPYFILRMLLDEVEGKMWVMSTGNGVTVLIDRIDLRERKIDFSYTLESYSGYDMTISGENVAVSTYRTNSGVDITLFNRRSGEKKEIVLPVHEVLGFNALGMLERNAKFYVSSMNGLYVFEQETYDITQFIENNTGSQFTYLIPGTEAIYAIDAYDRVYKINDEDMFHPELLLDAEGHGLTSLYYFINK